MHIIPTRRPSIAASTVRRGAPPSRPRFPRPAAAAPTSAPASRAVALSDVLAAAVVAAAVVAAAEAPVAVPVEVRQLPGGAS